MTDIDTILETEKRQHHKLDDPDLLAFATLTQIAHEQASARIRNRFKVGVVLCLVVALMALQAAGLNNLGFMQLSQGLSDLIARYPLALSVVNCAIVGAILVARRLRLI